jgi:hypothetical protein
VECTVKIDETGTPAASGDTVSGATSALDSAETSREGNLTTVGGADGKDTSMGIEGSPLPSDGSCSNMEFPVPHYGTISIGPCAYGTQIMNFVAFMWYVCTAVGCFAMIRSTVAGT